MEIAIASIELASLFSSSQFSRTPSYGLIYALLPALFHLLFPFHPLRSPFIISFTQPPQPSFPSISHHPWLVPTIFVKIAQIYLSKLHKCITQMFLSKMHKYICPNYTNIFVKITQIYLSKLHKYICIIYTNTFIPITQIYLSALYKYICAKYTNVFVQVTQMYLSKYII